MTKKFISLLISFAILLSCIVLPNKETVLGSTLTTIDLTNGISGEAPEHVCIYYYTYDDNYHWQVCQICGATKPKSSHSLQGNGGYKLDTSIYFGTTYRESCSCGYTTRYSLIRLGSPENYNSDDPNLLPVTYSEFQSINYSSHKLTGSDPYTWYDFDGDGYGNVYANAPVIEAVPSYSTASAATRGTLRIVTGSAHADGVSEMEEFWELIWYKTRVSNGSPTRQGFLNYLYNKIYSSSHPSLHKDNPIYQKYKNNVTNSQFNTLMSLFGKYNITCCYPCWQNHGFSVFYGGYRVSGQSPFGGNHTCYDSSQQINVGYYTAGTCDICNKYYDGLAIGYNTYSVNSTTTVNQELRNINGTTVSNTVSDIYYGNDLAAVHIDTFRNVNGTIQMKTKVIYQPGFTGSLQGETSWWTVPTVNNPSSTIAWGYPFSTTLYRTSNPSVKLKTHYIGLNYVAVDNHVPVAYNTSSSSYWKVIGNGSSSSLSNNLSILCTFSDIAQYTYNEVSMRIFDSDGVTPIKTKNGNTTMPLSLISGTKTNSGSTTVWQTQVDINTECTAPKTIYVQAIDSTGNTSEKIPMTVQYVDTIGPNLSVSSINSNWAQSKDVTITSSDINGITMGLDTSDWIGVTNSTYNNKRVYKFIGDVYSEKSVTIYSCDAVNNLTYTIFKVNKIDNTKPRFLGDFSVDYNAKKVSYSADDYNSSLNAQGSGVSGYRYIIDDNGSNYAISTSSGTFTSSSSITHDGTKPYLHIAVVDNAGNISDAKTVLISRYNVTYNANGGVNPPSAQVKVHNVNLVLSSTKPTRTGYTFQGWSKSSSGTTVDYNSGSTYTTNANLNLYAVWKANEYKLEIDPNGSMAKVGTKTSLYSPSEDTGTPLIFDTSNWSQIDVATRTGYDLKGYYDSATGGVEVYNKDGNCVTSTYWNSNSKYKNPNNLRVYAQWIAKQDIHYEVNHYLMDVNGSTYTFKEKVTYNNGTSDAEVTIANYKKVYDGFTYDGGYGDKVANASKPSTYSTTTTILQDGTRIINLYYTRNRYTLTVNPNGGVYEGSNIPKTYTMYYEETKEIKDPIKENAKFIGWSVNGIASTCTSNGKAELGGGTSIFKMGLANTTLTAYWSELPVFSSTALEGVFYEGQNVTVDMLKKLVTVSDIDKTPTKYDASDLTIESVTYKEGSTRVDTSFDNEYNLDTSSERIGQIVVKYSVKDVIPNMGNITDKKYDIVTVYFDRTVELAYNDLPSIEIEPYMYVYNGDKSLDKDTIGTVVKDYVTVKDIQDDVTTDWWNNEFTKSELRKSIEIVGVSNIEVSSAYLKDNPDFVNVIKDINTLEGIYSLLETAPDGFKAITSYRVTVDVKDQWGKYASGKLSEYALDKGVKHNGLRDKIQSDTDRTILVICTDDASYNNAYNGLRYVSTNYLGTLNANSYWGDVGYGNKELQAILQRGDQVHADNEIIPTNQSIGTYTKEDGSVVKLIINDYVSE